MVTRYAASFRLFGQPHPHGFVDGLSLVELQVGDRLKKILGTLKPTIEFGLRGHSCHACATRIQTPSEPSSEHPHSRATATLTAAEPPTKFDKSQVALRDNALLS